MRFLERSKQRCLLLFSFALLFGPNTLSPSSVWRFGLIGHHDRAVLNVIANGFERQFYAGVDKPYNRIMADENLQTDLSITAEINLYYDLFVPEDLSEPAPLLIAVHGYGAHKRYMMREARLIAPDGWAIAAIQAPHPHYRRTDDGYRIGFGWLSDHKPEEYVRLHHKFVLDVIDKLASDGTVDREMVFMYGFSQACALNFRFAFTHPEVMKGIVGVCGGIPGDLDTNGKYTPFNAQTFYLYGDDDEFYTQEQFAKFNEKLSATLPHFRSKHYTAKHEITQGMRVDIKDWLAKFI